MLERLQIKNFAIIEDIEVIFDNRMNVLTGETGAGKSIIIEALGLLCGNRSSYDKIRNGCEKAFIEGTFRIDNPQIIETFNQKYDFELESDVLIVSRTLDASMKTTMKLNGRSVPLSLGKELMNSLIDIHSQHKDRSYLDSSCHLEIYDRFLSSLLDEGENEVYRRYREQFEDYSLTLKRYQTMKASRLSDADLEYLQYQYQELKDAAIQDNEVEELEDKLRSVASYSKTLEIFQTIKEPLEQAFDELYSSKKILGQLKDETFDSSLKRFDESYFELEDAYHELLATFEKLNFNPYEIEEMKNRLFFLKGLMRKYGSSTAEMLNRLAQIEEDLNTYSNYDYNLNKLEKELNEKKAKLLDTALKLQALRHKYAPLLEEKVNRELKDLLLNNALFKVSFSETELFESGNEKVVFTLRANLGGRFLPLEETASLGEASRLNLALKTVFNALNPVETIVFDEIDTGVSGKVASCIGEKIHQLSLHSQAIVITHLAQVASKAEHHYRVIKTSDAQTTRTLITPLDDEERVKEIAGLLSNGTIDKTALDLARKMLEN